MNRPGEPIDEAFLIGGPERRDIVVVDYDPGWPGRFIAEQAKIRAALGAGTLEIEHIGSTAVPGLAANPVVDVLVVVPDVEDEAAYLPALERAGYLLRVREPGHRMLRTPGRDVHVHVRTAADPAVAAHLTFRDRLRADAGDRDRYAATKRHLARQQWPTMNHYAEAKTGIIREILARAIPESRPANVGPRDQSPQTPPPLHARRSGIVLRHNHRRGHHSEAGRQPPRPAQA